MLYFFIIVGLILLVWLIPKGMNAALRSGPGSVGESTRVIAKNYIFFRNPTNSGLPIDSSTPNFIIFELMYGFRQNLNQTVATRGDLLQVLDFDEFYNKYPFLDFEKEFLPCFILKILFFESADWRKNIKNVPATYKIKILEIIYDATLEVVPALRKDETKREYFIDLGLRCLDYWPKEYL